jgi:hypothetical protein
MKRIFFALAAGKMAAWFLLAGCSGDNATAGASTTSTGGSSTGSTGAGVGGASAAAVQAYCDATADAFCEAYFACCPGPDGWQWLGGTVENCKRLYRYGGKRCLWGVPERYAASIDAGHTIFDQASLDACVAHLKSMSSGGAACVEAIDTYFVFVCTTIVFQGQLAPGVPCTGVTGLPEGTVECKHGSCDRNTYTCKPLAQLGEPCNSSILGFYPDCEITGDLICASHPDPDAGLTCVHQGDIGELCTQDAECKSNNCDTTSGTCALPSPDSTCY